MSINEIHRFEYVFFVVYQTYGSVILKLPYLLPQCSKLPGMHFVFEHSLRLRMVLKCPTYCVIPGDQLCTYPVTFAKLNKRKEELLSQQQQQQKQFIYPINLLTCR